MKEISDNDDVVILSNFPMPPPQSALTRNVSTVLANGKRIGRVKTSRYKQYERTVMVWMMRHSQELKRARALTLRTGPKRFIHIDSTFKFHESAILCKDGTPRKNDTSNRLKALHDVLSKILGIDDSYFFSGTFDKIPISAQVDEGVEITLIICPL